MMKVQFVTSASFAKVKLISLNAKVLNQMESPMTAIDLVLDDSR